MWKGTLEKNMEEKEEKNKNNDLLMSIFGILCLVCFVLSILFYQRDQVGLMFDALSIIFIYVLISTCESTVKVMK